MCSSGYYLTVVDLKNRSIDLNKHFIDYDFKIYTEWYYNIDELNIFERKILYNQEQIKNYLKLFPNKKIKQIISFSTERFNVELYNNIANKLNELELLNRNTMKSFFVGDENTKPGEIIVKLN